MSSPEASIPVHRRERAAPCRPSPSGPAWFLALLLPLALWSREPAAGTPDRYREPAAASGRSEVEKAYSGRADAPLALFGREIFASPPPAGAPPLGAEREDRRLGVGDEVQVTLRGQRSSGRRYTVDTAGLLIVDDLRPVAAAGLTLAELRAELETAVAESMPHTEIFVSLTALRRIGVLVLGEVARPGRVQTDGRASVLDALLAAGGVTRNGSLRSIRLLGRQGERDIDLYDLLFAGDGGATAALDEGDRIVVPPLGPTFAVAGAVKRPAVYELPRASPPQEDALASVLALAGGPLRPGTDGAILFSFGPDGRETTRLIGPDEPYRPADGDLLLVGAGGAARHGAVEMAGHVGQPGPRSLEAAPTLGSLLADTELLPDTYLPFAVLLRIEPGTLARSLRAVDLDAVLEGRDDADLSEGDVLVVLGGEDVAFLTAGPVLDLLAGAPAPRFPGCAGLGVLARRIASDPGGVLAAGPLALSAAGLVPAEMPCPGIYDLHPDLLSFAVDHAILLRRGVPRPGLYPAAGRIGVERLAGFAGGVRPAAAELAVGGRRGARGRPASPGDIVEPAAPAFELAGHVHHPGRRPLPAGMTLSRVFTDAGPIREGAYPLAALIDRWDRTTLARSLIPFSPAEVSAGRTDRALEDGDRLLLFPAAGTGPLPDKVPPDAAPLDAAAPDPPASDPAIRSLLSELALSLSGEVRRPGRYPVAAPAPLGRLLAAAGGLTAAADPRSVEITDAAGLRVTVDLERPGSDLVRVERGGTVRVLPRAGLPEGGTVTISGEVRRPGRYDMARGERLSSLIARAGGLTDEAYPAGAVFTRASMRRAEAESFERTADEIERNIALMMTRDRPPPAEQVDVARRLAADLRGVRPIGRVAVEADPHALALRPELDPLLEPEDVLIVPKRPLSVAVAGEVLSPAFLRFEPGKAAADYIREAGGTTRNADEGRAFVLMPDGSSRPLALSFWNHHPVLVPPGATVVVPRDPKPFDLLEVSANIGTVLGQLATTAASIAVLSRQ
jgi:polysaccharide biosynthesis/export protein